MAIGIHYLHNPFSAVETYSPVPKALAIEITGKCNLRCMHCFNNSSPEKNSVLSLAAIEKIIKEANSWHLDEIRINGGEPTCHPEFKQIVDLIDKRKVSISLNTNGIYSGEMLSFLCKSPIAQFLISIDGAEENNDRIRGKDTFRQITESLRQLAANSKKVVLSFHADNQNWQDLQLLATLATSVRAIIKVSPVRSLGRAQNYKNLPTSRSIKDMITLIAHLRKLHPQLKIITDYDLLEDPLPGYPEQNALHACKAGRSMIHITSSGEIYPCGFLVTEKKEFCAGTIHSDSITALWKTSPVFRPFRIAVKNESCRQCSRYKRQCAGGCIANAYFRTGYIDESDHLCFHNPVMEHP